MHGCDYVERVKPTLASKPPFSWAYQVELNGGPHVARTDGYTMHISDDIDLYTESAFEVSDDKGKVIVSAGDNPPLGKPTAQAGRVIQAQIDSMPGEYHYSFSLTYREVNTLLALRDTMVEEAVTLAHAGGAGWIIAGDRVVMQTRDVPIIMGTDNRLENQPGVIAQFGMSLFCQALVKHHGAEFMFHTRETQRATKPFKPVMIEIETYDTDYGEMEYRRIALLAQYNGFFSLPTWVEKTAGVKANELYNLAMMTRNEQLRTPLT